MLVIELIKFVARLLKLYRYYIKYGFKLYKDNYIKMNE